MREILFRGKRLNDEENNWAYGSYVKQYDCDMIYFSKAESDGFEYAHIIPETVGQYTGLTDKNGKKIFEGDILQVDVQEYKEKLEDFWGKLRTRRVFTGKYIKALWTVEYKEHFCKGNGYYGYGKDRRFNKSLTKSTLFNVNAEVIGNIHDNPELLKGGAE